MNLIHLLQDVCERVPDKAAFIEGDHTITYRKFFRKTQGIACGLRKAGIGAGERLLVLMPLSVSLYATLCAAWTLGASVVMFDPSAGRKHIQSCLDELPVKAFVGNRKSLLLRWISPPIRKIPAFHNVASLGRNAEAAEEIAQTTEDTPALITFTSGSTATPKAIVRTHGFLLKQHAALVRCMPYHSGDVDLAVLPVFTLINLVEGITTVLPDDSLSDISKVDAARLVAQIGRHGVSRITASPALLDRLCGYARQEGIFLEGLRSVHVGGGPVFLDILERMSVAMDPEAIEMVYGSTEAEPIATIKWLEVGEEQKQGMKTGAGLLAGKPVEALQTAVIRNRSGVPLGQLTEGEFDALLQPTGAAGEIVVAGDHVVRGYLRPEQDRNNKIRVGDTVWHRTGDCGYLDGEGNLWLLGRASQVLRHGETEIYPFAVESAIRAAYGCKSAVCTDGEGNPVLAVESGEHLAQIEREYGGRFRRIVAVKAIPVDRRHASKVDYVVLRRMIR